MYFASVAHAHFFCFFAANYMGNFLNLGGQSLQTSSGSRAVHPRCTQTPGVLKRSRRQRRSGSHVVKESWCCVALCCLKTDPYMYVFAWGNNPWGRNYFRSRSIYGFLDEHDILFGYACRVAILVCGKKNNSESSKPCQHFGDGR